MKRLIYSSHVFLLCLFLTGCFERTKNAPNPKPEDTILKSPVKLSAGTQSAHSGYFKQLPGRDEKIRPSAGKKYGNLYDEKDICASIYFEFDRAALSKESRDTLNQVSRLLEKNPQAHLLIVGHCDWYGTEDYNLKLGERRAKSAERYLLNLGAKEPAMETLSLGSTHATQGLPKENTWQERRCDLVLFPTDIR